MKRSLEWLLVAGLLGWTSAVSAQPVLDRLPLIPATPANQTILPALANDGCDANCANLSDRDPFTAGSLTYQGMVGYFTRASVGPGGVPLNYTPVGFRFGCILNTPEGDDWMRGCGEVLIEANYSRIMGSLGTYFAGPNAILRYNFVQPDCLLVPYIQAGAGFNVNDVWRTPTQALIGQNVELFLRAEVGTRIMITEAVSFDIEAGFQNISSAGLGKHASGLSNMGASVGFTYFFGKVQ